MLVDNIAVTINQIAFSVHTFTISINEVALLILVQYWVTKRVHLEITQDVFDVEFSEWEDLWNFVVFQVLPLKDLSSILVNDISEFVNQVPLGVDPSAEVVNELAILVSLWLNVSVFVLVNLAQAINYIESSTIVVEELWKVSILGSVGLGNLHPPIIVYNVACLIDTISSATYSAPWFVGEFPFLVLLDDCFPIPVEVEVASHQVGVEVVLLNIERCRNFTLLVQLSLLEHGSPVQIVDHIPGLLVDEVASLIRRPTLFVPKLTILVLCRQYVAFLISVEFANDITFVEPS